MSVTCEHKVSTQRSDSFSGDVTAYR